MSDGWRRQSIRPTSMLWRAPTRYCPRCFRRWAVTKGLPRLLRSVPALSTLLRATGWCRAVPCLAPGAPKWSMWAARFSASRATFRSKWLPRSPSTRPPPFGTETVVDLLGLAVIAEAWGGGPNRVPPFFFPTHSTMAITLFFALGLTNTMRPHVVIPLAPFPPLPGLFSRLCRIAGCWSTLPTSRKEIA